MISVKMRKNYKLVRILGITLLEKGDREYKNKKNCIIFIFLLDLIKITSIYAFVFKWSHRLEA